MNESCPIVMTVTGSNEQEDAALVVVEVIQVDLGLVPALRVENEILVVTSNADHTILIVEIQVDLHPWMRMRDEAIILSQDSTAPVVSTVLL